MPSIILHGKSFLFWEQLVAFKGLIVLLKDTLAGIQRSTLCDHRRPERKSMAAAGYDEPSEVRKIEPISLAPIGQAYSIVLIPLLEALHATLRPYGRVQAAAIGRTDNFNLSKGILQNLYGSEHLDRSGGNTKAGNQRFPAALLISSNASIESSVSSYFVLAMDRRDSSIYSSPPSAISSLTIKRQ
jgi:hypothetical protein